MYTTAQKILVGLCALSAIRTCDLQNQMKWKDNRESRLGFGRQQLSRI